MPSSPPLAESLASFAESLSAASEVEELERTYMLGAREHAGLDVKLGFYLLDPDSHEVEHIGATGVSDFFLARYEEAGRAVDPLLRRVLAHGETGSTAELMSPGAWRRHPLYTEVCHLHDFAWVAEAPILARGRVAGTLYFAAGRGDRPPSSRILAIGETLGRLVGLALSSLRERETLTRERDGAIAALELCDEALAVTDLRTGQRMLNLAARRILDAIAPADSTVLLDELMAEERPLEGGGSLARAAVSLADGASAVLSVRTTQLEADPLTRVSFLILDPPGEEILPLQVEGALTQREQEVARLVISGLHDAEIAERLVISPHTVNQHLKRVYAKLGVESRVALTRLALGREPTSDRRSRD